MKVTFLRHGSSPPPFDDYNTLTLRELSQLAEQQVNPSIDPTKVGDKLKKANYLDGKYDKVLVSASKRTQDTSLELSKHINLPQFVVWDELNEILFNPSQLVTESEYEESKLSVIRQKLFKALANNSNIETGDEVVRRLLRLDSRLKGLSVNAVLIITHGFFMRYLDIFYRQKSGEFGEAALNRAINYDYASGFTVITN